MNHPGPDHELVRCTPVLFAEAQGKLADTVAF